MFLANELELVILTNERLLIEKRGVVEKLTRTEHLQIVNIDQISSISYSRAPVNYPTIIFSSVFIFLLLIPFFLGFTSVIPEINFLVEVIILIILAPFLYLFWWGLRLTKRSIVIQVIGLTKLVTIGEKKGAPIWFLKSFQEAVFERIHHTFHSQATGTDHKHIDEDSHLEITEYPSNTAR